MTKDDYDAAIGQRWTLVGLIEAMQPVTFAGHWETTASALRPRRL